MSNEMTLQEIIDYIVEKFNLYLEIPKEQLTQFVTQLCEKIIIWEIVTSALVIMVNVIVFMLLAFIVKQYSKKNSVNIKDIVKTAYFESYKNLEDIMYKLKPKTKEFTVEQVISFKATVIFITAILIFASIMMVTSLFSESLDILYSFIFSEKVILEFIGQYI